MTQKFHLNHSFDEECRDDGEENAGDKFEEAVEPDIYLVQVDIRHLKKYNGSVGYNYQDMKPCQMALIVQRKAMIIKKDYPSASAFHSLSLLSLLISRLSYSIT